MIQQPKELELLKQLIGDWSAGTALKTKHHEVVSSCGENDIWSFDHTSSKVYIFSS